MRLHFVGIGGIGVSALAKYHLSQGAEISGSDLASSEITQELQMRGAKICIGKHNRANLPEGVDLLVHTPAVSPKNPELAAARKKKVPVRSYPEAIGELTREVKTITISGSHGKSTTTALAALVLEEGYFDPTVIVGTKVKEFGNSNFRRGQGPYLLLEADEWNKSFLNYSPAMAVVTNIDAEHLDTYKNIEAAEKTFAKYLARVPAGGKIIANRDDPRLARVANKFSAKGGSLPDRLPAGQAGQAGASGGKNRVVWYSRQDPEAETVRKILKIPGEHNVSNALAALKLGRALGIADSAILRGLSRFSGAWRRFEFRGVLNGAQIFDDYGHHPSEITATIKAARSRFPFRRIWCVFQPHQYQRLHYLWDSFVTAFDLADRVCLLPVYEVAGRERAVNPALARKSGVNSKKLAQALNERGKNACHLKDFAEAHAYLAEAARPGDVVLMMGAGDIYNLTGQLFTA